MANKFYISRGLLSAAFLFLSIPFLRAQERFRQDIQYRIRAELDEQRHILCGTVEFTLQNNAAVGLDTLWLQIGANAYSTSKSELAKQLTDKRNEKLRLRPNYYGGATDSLAFTINGEVVQFFQHEKYADFVYILLKAPLQPGGSVRVFTPFKLSLPHASVATLGHKKNDYYFTHWYPKPAVYDAGGWHLNSLTDQGNPYTSFADYEVEITLPKSYVVSSTGNLISAEEASFLTERAKLSLNLPEKGKILPFPETEGKKTIRFKASRVNDFAFFASKQFAVQTDTLVLASGKKITLYCFYHPGFHKLWKPEMEYMKKILNYFSNRLGDYPYDTFTMTDGPGYAGFDRSYPGLAVLGYKRSRLDLEDISIRLIGQQWLSCAMGPDETQHPWMGEGLNAYYTRRYLRDFKPSYNGLPIPVLPVLGLRFLKRNDLDYIPYQYKVRRGNDQASGLAADAYGDGNYGIAVRGQNSMFFYHLEQYLGSEVFDQILKKYVETYRFSSPGPKEFRVLFEKESGKDLSWFFEELLLEKAYIDYAVKSVKSEMNPETGEMSTAIQIENRGTSTAPFPIYVYADEKKPGEPRWIEGFKGVETIYIPVNKNNTVQIDHREVMPEINRKNNTYRTGEIIPKLEKVRFNFIMGPPEMNGRNQVFYLPVTLWNNYNKSMAGFAIHNKTPIRKKFEYLFAPMVSLNPIGFAGVGIISGSFATPRSRLIESFSYKLAYTRFGYFFDTEARDWNRIMPKLMLNFRPPFPQSERKTQLYIRSIFNFLESTDDYRAAFGRNNLAFNVNEIGFSMRDNRLLHPYQLLIWAEYIAELDKFSKPGVEAGMAGKLSIEYRQKINYISAVKGLDIRFFGGMFLNNPKTVLDYRYRLSGHPGFWDYKFDNYYLGRAETRGLLSRQFYEYDGGFKILTPLGQTSRWMLALNLKASIPGPIPIKPYFDVAVHRQVLTMAGTGELQKSVQLSYSGGIMLSVINDVLEIYVPLYHSKDIRDYISLSGTKFWQHIRFRLNMQELNPKRIKEKLEWLPR